MMWRIMPTRPPRESWGSLRGWGPGWAARPAPARQGSRCGLSGSLAAAQASPALRKTMEQLAGRTQTLLEQSRPFAGDITDRRLALEVGVIQTLAESLAARLTRRDPLSERVHHHPAEAIGLALRGGLGVVACSLRPLR